MIYLYLWGLLWIWDLISQPSATLVNEARVRAEEAFVGGDYQSAAEYYRQVVEASIFSDPAARLNMANALYLAGSIETAYKNYLIVSRVDDPSLAATAISRLGVIALGKEDTIAALTRLREAILLNRNNPVVIADFEILRSRYSGSMEVPGKEGSDSEEPDSLSRVGGNTLTAGNVKEAVVERSDQREQLLQNLDRINMSEEQAKSVLDAMKVNERQYSYQLRRLGARQGAATGKKIEW